MSYLDALTEIASIDTMAGSPNSAGEQPWHGALVYAVQRAQKALDEPGFVGVRHIPFNPKPWASMARQDSELPGICEEQEQEDWGLVRVVPVNETEHIAVFERRTG